VSLVAFPFTDEEPEGVLANVRSARAHPRVAEVMCVGTVRNETYGALERLASETPGVSVTVQRRIGSLRAGKGDAMNTALADYLRLSQEPRIHFYDADMANFDGTWIDKAERAADAGFDVVRHSFPRASTDAMITWMITRLGFATLWPDTELARIGQPLGGEFLLSRSAAETLAADPRVGAHSDWGIDTVITFVTVQREFRLYETFIASGKDHRLYGSLRELATMLAECLAAIQRLAGEVVAPGTPHELESPSPPTGTIATKIAYSVDDAIALLGDGWTNRQTDLLDLLPPETAAGMRAARLYPSVRFMDEDIWHATFLRLLRLFDASDGDWRALLFRLWVARVLHYTFTEALKGFEAATGYLEAMIERTIRRSKAAG
jgi:mannosylglycerate synthase